MSAAQDVTQLMRDAITAAREGDKPRARALLEQVVELDPENEKAWFWLASVVETDEERRVCLGNVVFINPNNERAQKLLAQLETRQETERARAAEVVPGISRRTLIAVIAFAAVVVIVVCGVVALIIANNASRAAEERVATEAIQAQTQVFADAATEAFLATQTVALAVATPTPIGPTLPPTWTPLPSPTPISRATATPLATAVGNPLFRGRILAASGPDIAGQGYVPIVEIPLDGSPPQTHFDERGGSPSMSLDGRLLVYTRYSSGTGEQALELAWTDGSRQPRLLSQMLGTTILTRQTDASFSPDGTAIAFTAREPGSANSDLYVFSLAAAGVLGGSEGEVPEEIASQALRRLTDGSIRSAAPAWGDATHLVFVADARPGGGEVDLRIVTFRPQSATTFADVTHDGNALIENNPSWSPDGARIAYEAAAPDNPNDVDIYLTLAGGSGQPLKIVDSDFADVRPRWSPDGAFLVYSSNRGGSWEIYIVDVTTYANYQVTLNDVYDLANDWAP